MSSEVTGNGGFTRFSISGDVIGVSLITHSLSHQEAHNRYQCCNVYNLGSYTTTTYTVTGCNHVTSGVFKRRSGGDA